MKLRDILENISDFEVIISNDKSDTMIIKNDIDNSLIEKYIDDEVDHIKSEIRYGKSFIRIEM